ncbi:MAG: lactate utilization protein [Clostridiales bacterium]|nr:lactate utilization protein [Clostridiales bacterium]
MTPKEQYYENIAGTIMKNLEKRRMAGYYCPTAEEAANLAMTLIAPGASVGTGGSMTLEECGIMSQLRSRKDITFLDRSAAKTPE